MSERFDYDGLLEVNDALRAENARFRAVLMNMQAAWNNKNEVTSVYVWNERMKAAMADVDAALQPERGGGVKPRSGLGEQLYALYIYPGGTFDGDLVSKQCRDELIKQGLAWRYGGYNFISEKGKQLIEPTPQEDAP